jgi:hypothetical protein
MKTKTPYKYDGFALVTGGGSGIGFEFAHLLALRGWNLLLVGRSLQKLQTAAASLDKEYPSIEVQTLSSDLSVPGEPQRVVEECRRRQLSVRMLINNAGRGLYGTLLQQDPAQLQQMLRLNIEALMLLTRSFAGTADYILNVGSVAGRLPMPRYAAYGASKSFVREFTLALRQELLGAAKASKRPKAPKLSVLEPGYVNTGFDKNAGIENRRYMKFSVSNSMTARRVAEIGLRGLLAGRPVIVPGLRNRAMVTLTRLLPKTLTARVVWKAFSTLTADESGGSL